VGAGRGKGATQLSASLPGFLKKIKLNLKKQKE
jgi:hypothetical protein